MQFQILNVNVCIVYLVYRNILIVLGQVLTYIMF